MQKDLTTGSVFKNVLYFSLPYLLSYFLQTLYGMADLFIIGQFEGTVSITAVSIGSQIMHMITVIANRRGLTDAAAVGIVEKIISFIFLVPSSMLSTVSALGAQNVGAGKHDRAAKTLYYAIGISLTFGAIVGVLVQFIAPDAVALFTTDAAVAVAGGWYLRGYIWDCFFAGIHFSFSGYFCAYGRSELSFLHNILSIVLVRVPGAYFMSKLFPDNLLPMGLATAVGSLLSVVICLTAYLLLKRKGTFGGKVAA